MKKNFAPSKILKIFRLRRKTLLGGLLVLVVVLLAAAVWRGFLPVPAVLLPWRATEASREAETDKEPVETPAQGGEYENESAAGAGQKRKQPLCRRCRQTMSCSLWRADLGRPS